MLLSNEPWLIASINAGKCVENWTQVYHVFSWNYHPPCPRQINWGIYLKWIWMLPEMSWCKGVMLICELKSSRWSETKFFDCVRFYTHPSDLTQYMNRNHHTRSLSLAKGSLLISYIRINKLHHFCHHFKTPFEMSNRFHTRDQHLIYTSSRTIECLQKFVDSKKHMAIFHS